MENGFVDIRPGFFEDVGNAVKSNLIFPVLVGFDPPEFFLDALRGQKAVDADRAVVGNDAENALGLFAAEVVRIGVGIAVGMLPNGRWGGGRAFWDRVSKANSGRRV